MTGQRFFTQSPDKGNSFGGYEACMAGRMRKALAKWSYLVYAFSVKCLPGRGSRRTPVRKNGIDPEQSARKGAAEHAGRDPGPEKGMKP